MSLRWCCESCNHLGAGDAEKLKAFADQHQVQWWLQTAGPDSAEPYYPVAFGFALSVTRVRRQDAV